MKKRIVLLLCGTLLVCHWVCGQNVSEPEMIFVQGGSFTMGCTYEQTGLCNTDESPTHEVTVTGFAIAKYEVTQALWQAVMGINPSYFISDNCGNGCLTASTCGCRDCE